MGYAKKRKNIRKKEVEKNKNRHKDVRCIENNGHKDARHEKRER
jgi:hypothetical protein